MRTLRDYIEENPPDTKKELRGTPKQRRVWEAVLRDWDQTPSEVARKAGCDNSYVSYVLKRTTPEMLEEYRETRENQTDRMSLMGEEESPGDTHIYIFSDMDAEEIRDFLRI